MYLNISYVFYYHFFIFFYFYEELFRYLLHLTKFIDPKNKNSYYLE